MLVDAMKQMLGDAGPQRDKMFFVVHTMGSHFNETSRYPRDFDVFPDDDGNLSDKARLINSYDNTIDHTDRVLSD